jgi:uncharacterized protein (DUF305 family)
VLVLLAGLSAGATAALLVTRAPGNGSAEAGFARDMMVHHAQAVQMAEIERDRTQSDVMRLLASDISLTQQAQIGIMQGWLQVWGLLPSGTEPAMAWMGHPMHGPMPGMASPEELERLSKAPPDVADVLFLRLMIVHHQAAIPMSEAILKRTDVPYIRQLAQSIMVSQRAEIQNMKAMIESKVGDSAEVDLQPQNGSGTTGKVTLSKTDGGGGVRVVLDVSGLPRSETTYLAHIHPGTCEEEAAGGGGSHEHAALGHGTAKEIEYPLTPVEPDGQGDGSSTTVLKHVTFEGLLSGDPKHINVHAPGSGEPPPVTCTNLNEAV